MEIEIKPCPFCGHLANIFVCNKKDLSNIMPIKAIDKKPDKTYHIVRCTNCLCSTCMFESLDDAIKTWNTRI